MKNKGFTLVELLAVVVILGLLTAVAMISISNYMNRVNKEERDTLRSTITSSLQNYRVKNTVTKEMNITLNNLSFSRPLSYSKKDCDVENSYVYFVEKKDYDGSSSSQEVFCIYLTCGSETVLNDKEENNTYCKN